MTRRLLPRAERRRTILEGAARAFATAGFAATSMDDVAREAGVTKMIVYQHMASKEELYEAVLVETAARLDEAAGPYPIGPDGLRAVFAVARESPDAFLLLFRHAAREPRFSAHAAQVTDRGVAMTEGLLAGRIADPVMRRWAARLAMQHAVDGVIAWLEVGDPARDEEAAERLLASCGALVDRLAEPLSSRL